MLRYSFHSGLSAEKKNNNNNKQKTHPSTGTDCRDCTDNRETLRRRLKERAKNDDLFSGFKGRTETTGTRSTEKSGIMVEVELKLNCSFPE